MIPRRRSRRFAAGVASIAPVAHGWLAPASTVSRQHRWDAASDRRRRRVQHRLHSLPPGVTDPQENLPSGWEVWDEGGTYTYYNVIEDPYYERPTTVHPFYGDVRSAEAIASAPASPRPQREIHSVASPRFDSRARASDDAPSTPMAFSLR